MRQLQSPQPQPKHKAPAVPVAMDQQVVAVEVVARVMGVFVSSEWLLPTW